MVPTSFRQTPAQRAALDALCVAETVERGRLVHRSELITEALRALAERRGVAWPS